MSKKILCIDDKPATTIGNKPMNQHLVDMFDELIKTDPDIDVILLDIMFDGIPLGAEIADTVNDLRPDIKVVVLTSLDEKGKKISLGQRKNVWCYFVKNDMAEHTGSSHLFRIVRGLVEDPFNKNWQIDFVPEDSSLTLIHREYELEIPLTVKNKDQLNTIDACLLNRGQCIDEAEIADKTTGYSLSKVVKAINDRVIEHSGYRTWGILNSKNCANKAVKILIGPDRDENPQVESPELKEELASLSNRVITLEKRVAELEARLLTP